MTDTTTGSIVITADGSKTLFCSRLGEHYHSLFGAENESNHVFVNAGFQAVGGDTLSILETGFGTGLNAWLTLQQAVKMFRSVYYEAIELYPVENEIASNLNDNNLFRSLHASQWEKPVEIVPGFVLHKRKSDLLDTYFTKKFDLVYFDAFSPAVQPELWDISIFTRIFEAMNPNAVLTTYCAKGEVRRTMQKVGFTVERLNGPYGKREILRAKKV